MYWGDVGPDAGIDSITRGPRGLDEVNQAKAPGFFGWPLLIGDNKPYFAYDFETQTSGAPFDPAAPVNNSRFNTGSTELPPAQPAFLWYPYDGSVEFPLLGDGGRNSHGWPCFFILMIILIVRVDTQIYYDGKLFIYEWMRGWIIAVTLDENGDYVRMERFLAQQNFSNPTDMIFGPEGDLFMLEYGTGWFQQNEDARLIQIKYTAGQSKTSSGYQE